MLTLVTPLDPLHGDGYQFWSGIGSGSPILLGLAVLWRHHNCHRPRCWRLAWHPDADGHPVCRVHHPGHPAQSGRLVRLLAVVAARLRR